MKVNEILLITISSSPFISLNLSQLFNLHTIKHKYNQKLLNSDVSLNHECLNIFSNESLSDGLLFRILVIKSLASALMLSYT